MSREPGEKASDPRAGMGREIGRKADRKLRARAERQHSIWFGLGLLGVVGWAVVVPTVLGAAFGRWLDARWPGRVSWTLTFLLVGLGVGCLSAWRWVKRESGHTE
jgi:ATP synthase protein I